MSGKIYKISGGGLNYYGSTTSKLGTRKSQHKYYFKQYKLGKVCYITAFDIFEKCDDWIMEIVEDNIEKEHLAIREGFYIKNNECVNKMVAGRTNKEYYEDNEEKMKKYKSQWAKDNREDIKNKYNENKDVINEVRRLHMSSDEMKKKKNEQDAKYREKNQEKAPCDICGTVVLVRRLKEHKKVSKSCKKLSESNSTK